MTWYCKIIGIWLYVFCGMSYVPLNAEKDTRKKEKDTEVL